MQIVEGSILPCHVNGFDFNMTYCPPGEFWMGSNIGVGCGDEHPRHKVTLTRGFWMGETQVTQALWSAVMNSKPSCFIGDTLPVEQVSWFDCVLFCNRMSALNGLENAYEIYGKYVTLNNNSTGYRLPTEAEWEYAAKAGTEEKYAGGNPLADVAWHSVNSYEKTHAVGQKRPNNWGLYDMTGNVWEWCSDGWVDNYNSRVHGVIDPLYNNQAATGRVRRGGSCAEDALTCRIAYRSGYTPDYNSKYLGLRLSKMATHIVQIRSHSVQGVEFKMVYCPPRVLGYENAVAKEQASPTLTQGFWIGQTVVTQALWEKVMGKNPSNFNGANLPVEHISWYDAVRFCNELSRLENLNPMYEIGLGDNPSVSIDPTATGYRLPTEAEWEYAAKAGTELEYAGSNNPDSVAWHYGNSRSTQPVGGKKPNLFGAYDMSGNVFEWCADLWDEQDEQVSLRDRVFQRVIRGGSWRLDAENCSVGFREQNAPNIPSDDLGMRLLRLG